VEVITVKRYSLTKHTFKMKKTILSLLVVACLCIATTKVQAQWQYYSNHPHQHLTASIETVLDDRNGTGRIVQNVSMHVDLASHPGLSIVHSWMGIGYESWDDHWRVDSDGTSAYYFRQIEYNWNDPPYWLSCGFTVEYSDGTYEEWGYDHYF
jgi:hypothetical protein